MKEFTVAKNDSGQRLDRFVSKTVPLLPSSLLQKYIRLKRIKINGRGAKRDTRLNLGDIVSMYVNDEFFETPTDENSYLAITKPNLSVVYEDENILLADKKPGMLCHSDGKNLSFTTEKNTGIDTNPAQTEAEGYIGNINSHVFHRTSCSGLPDEKNRIYFSGRSEAVAAGYSPCGRCEP